MILGVRPKCAVKKYKYKLEFYSKMICVSKTYYCFYLKLVSYYSVFAVSGRVFAQGWCQNLCKNLPLIVFKDSDNFWLA